MLTRPGLRDPTLFLTATFTIVGATIGAGILGLPFAIAKIGFLPGTVLLLLTGMASMVLNMMYAEVILRTRSDHEIPGYGGLYLGNGAKMMALLAGTVGGYGALLAYIIGESRVLASLFGGMPIVWGTLFTLFGSYIVYRGLDVVKKIEFVLSIALLCILFLIGVAVHPHIEPANLARVDINNLAVPYGVLVFAFAGTGAVPLVRQQLKGQEKLIPRVILTANALIMIAYFLFVWVVLGTTGANTTDIATLGLARAIGPWMGLLGNLLAGVTLLSGFVVMGLSLRRVFEHDYGLIRPQALLAVVTIPLLLFVFGARGFVSVLGLTGGIVLSVQGVLIVLSFWRAQRASFLHRIFPTEDGRNPEFSLGSFRLIGGVMLALYVAGAVLTVLNHVY